VCVYARDGRYLPNLEKGRCDTFTNWKLGVAKAVALETAAISFTFTSRTASYFIFIYIFMRIHTQNLTFSRIHTHTCAHIHTHTHTHTHAHTRSSFTFTLRPRGSIMLKSLAALSKCLAIYCTPLHHAKTRTHSRTYTFLPTPMRQHRTTIFRPK